MYVQTNEMEMSGLQSDAIRVEIGAHRLFLTGALHGRLPKDCDSSSE
jgi:hypothetical protein